MDLAVEKFKSRAAEWPLYNFPGLLTTVLDSTSENDNGFRPVVADIFARHVNELTGILENIPDQDEGQREWVQVFDSHSEFLYGVFRRAISQKSAELRDMTSGCVIPDLEWPS